MRQIDASCRLHLVAALVFFALVTAPAAPAAAGELARGIRFKLAAGDLKTGEAFAEEWRAEHGEDAEYLNGLGWLARGYQMLGDEVTALRYVRELREKIPAETEELVVPLGAAIEVEGRILLAREGRAAALDFWGREAERARDPSLRSRIWKNIDLVTLEGSAAPEIDFSDSIGAAPASLASLRGRPVLLFFWAHWCGDCRDQAPVVARLAAKYAPLGLAVVAPTRYYGRGMEGKEATREEERRHVAEVLATTPSYEGFGAIPVPISEAAMVRYGASATPTLALLDRQGEIALYTPTRMTEAELSRRIEALLAE
ncbi:MAG: TlpA family protein disulfide reductase [Acidobacteria bacterium]|nr:TlpA family protein disulfide reductase [Acidobacteriota bacterium]